MSLRVTDTDLFAKIGRLTVENDLLHDRAVQLEARIAELEPEREDAQSPVDTPGATAP